MTISGRSALHSTEKAEFPVESPLSNESVDTILSKLSPEEDRFDPNVEEKEFLWSWPRWLYPKRRLHREQAEEVQKYINIIIRREYPYHIREYMGRNLWLEFCEYYAINPDFAKALKYL